LTVSSAQAHNDRIGMLKLASANDLAART